MLPRKSIRPADVIPPSELTKIIQLDLSSKENWLLATQRTVTTCTPKLIAWDCSTNEVLTEHAHKCMAPCLDVSCIAYLSAPELTSREGAILVTAQGQAWALCSRSGRFGRCKHQLRASGPGMSEPSSLGQRRLQVGPTRPVVACGWHL